MALERLQGGDVPIEVVEVEDLSVPTASGRPISVRLFRPPDHSGVLPAVIYLHGSAWIFGSRLTHDRLMRELCAGTGSVVVFPSYALPSAPDCPSAIEEIYSVLVWCAEYGDGVGIDARRIAVAGDSVGGSMAVALTLLVKQRSGPQLAAQLLYYPVLGEDFDTASYLEFGEGCYLRRDAVQNVWDRYLRAELEHFDVTASPLRATRQQLTGLPPALIITGEADVVRDEGETYAGKLRQAGVQVLATRYQGMVHDFVVLNALRSTRAAEGAIPQAIAFLTEQLGSS